MLIKVTGGFTAQLLALMNAIYLSHKFHRTFKFRYFPHSTGTFWPFEISSLLESKELESIVGTKGIEQSKISSPGSFISDFPTRGGGFSYAKIINIFYFFGLDRIVKRVFGEYVVAGKIARLKKVPPNSKTITGIFPPLLDPDVINEVSRRIDKSGFKNPFKETSMARDIVIHYRLGDMRKMPARTQDLGGHGVVDPMVFYEILSGLDSISNTPEIFIVSDEPDLAVKLLEEAGFKKLFKVESSNVWDDLCVIASARVFIGSLSQFSTFGAIACHHQGGKVFLPSNTYGKSLTRLDFGLEEFNYCEYRYLKPDHWLFSFNS
jgi:hypothetical protein